MFYKDDDIPNGEYKLVQCISACNHANECFISTVRIVNCKINVSEFDRAQEQWDGIGVGLDNKVFTPIAITHGRPLTNTSVLISKSDPKRRLIFKSFDASNASMAKCIEYTPERKIATINTKTCKFTLQGNTAALTEVAVDPPSRFTDDGLCETEKEFTTCFCTFLAMYQREVSTGDSQLSIKRYFCNEPYNQDPLKWKVYGGRVDETDFESERFVEKKTVRWIDDKYVGERLNSQAKTWTDAEPIISGGLIRYRGEHCHIFINLFIVLQHWARHDAVKGPKADELLWKLDQTYSPYDRFYRQSFPNAHETNLRTYDFTITQCLRNWIYGLYMYADYSSADTDNVDIKQQEMDAIIFPMIDLHVAELNTLLVGSTEFPTPISAGTDMSEADPDHVSYTQRAREIMQNALKAAFPGIEKNPHVIQDDGTLHRQGFKEYILHNCSRPTTHKIPPLSTLATAKLNGKYIPTEEPAYEIISNMKQLPIISPLRMKRNDLMLIYDPDGVSIAYFDAVVWIDRSQSLGIELGAYNAKTREEEETMSRIAERDRDAVYFINHLRRQAATRNIYRRKKFQFWIPLVTYSMTRMDRPDPQFYVRDLFNVFTVPMDKSHELDDI